MFFTFSKNTKNLTKLGLA